MKPPKQRFHVSKNYGESRLGGFDFEVGDRRSGQIIALCWSRRMANRIRTMLNHAEKKTTR